MLRHRRPPIQTRAALGWPGAPLSRFLCQTVGRKLPAAAAGTALWTSERRTAPCVTSTWTPTASPAPSNIRSHTPSLRWLSTSTGSTRTSFVRVLVGVSQGDRLSPTLVGLDALARFCTDWDMDVNLAKTRVVVFNSGRGWRPSSQPAPAHLAPPGAAGGVGPAVQVPGAHFLRRPGLRCCAGQLGAIQGMCANSDITDPSIRLHMWQQLVLPMVSYGCEIWGAQHRHFTERAYFDTNPGEEVHLAFLRWCTGAGPRRTGASSWRRPTSCRCSSSSLLT
jgi:hypothetical protein